MASKTCAVYLRYLSRGVQNSSIRVSPVAGHTRGIASAALARETKLATPDGVQLPLPQVPKVTLAEERVKNARPFSDFLTDTFNRQHDYLRISLTEKCNLRCLYCMPEEGIPLSPPGELLTTPEIILLSSVFVSQGVTKIRLTGGEPTVRRDILPLMQQLGTLRRHGLREMCLTTNGIALHRKLEDMVEAGLTGVNLSLDTLDPYQFQIMTRRNGFAAVQKSLERIFELNKAGAGIKFKINCVVMRKMNDHEILPFVEMTREKDVEVRFIEYMPFDGNKWSEGKMFGYQEMLTRIREKYPTLQKVLDHKNDTSKTYHVPGFAGRVGFITSMTHNFCGTCNRLRITNDGNLKVCLFGNAEVSLRDIIRKTNKGKPIDEEALEAMKQVALALEQNLADADIPPNFIPNSQELLDVIGMAVKRKKAKHAGIGQLEHMKNRPMILIGDTRKQQQPSSHVLTQQPCSFLDAKLPPSLRGLPFTPWTRILSKPPSARLFSSCSNRLCKPEDSKAASSPKSAAPTLTHVSPSGSAQMVSISSKEPTSRIAAAVCTVHFSNPTAASLIRANEMQKGDVLGVARIAGIMATKRTPDLIPLCHPIAVSHVSVDLDLVDDTSHGNGHGRVEIRATVECDGKTGVEMEALSGASVAALTVYDMCKAVDKGMRIEGLRVVLKEGGESGRWVEGVHVGSSSDKSYQSSSR